MDDLNTYRFNIVLWCYVYQHILLNVQLYVQYLRYILYKYLSIICDDYVNMFYRIHLYIRATEFIAFRYTLLGSIFNMTIGYCDFVHCTGASRIYRHIILWNVETTSDQTYIVGLIQCIERFCTFTPVPSKSGPLQCQCTTPCRIEGSQTKCAK